MLSLWMCVAGIQMFLTLYHGEYTRVKAVCKQIFTTPILKRPKALILSTEQGDLRLRILRHIWNPEVGDIFLIYLSDNTRFFHTGNEYVADSYLGILRVCDNAKKSVT